MENTFNKAYMAMVSRTASRDQWLAIYSSYRCALTVYRGNNSSESLMAEGLLTHDLGLMLSDMMAAPKRSARTKLISHKSLLIRHKLRHVATH
jgi:hypothetical protein